ncbi:MAG: transposase [Armatimonadetes bacterium]|nr:transposase [Armatimonadota bacterium]
MTTNCDPGGPGLADGACRTLVQEGVHGLFGRGACRLDAYVVMPTHVHILFVLAETKSLSDTMRDFKKYEVHSLARESPSRPYWGVLAGGVP